MVQGTIKKPDGTDLITFDIPSNLSEVKITRFIDFLVESRALDTGEPATDIVTMTKAVSAFLGVELNVLLDASAGVFKTGPDSFAGSISRLYGYIVKMIGAFKPELMIPDYEFDYQGERYHVPTIIQQAIGGEYALPDLSVAEVVEVAEVGRWKQQVVSQRGDKDGALRKKIDDMVAEQIKAAGGDPLNLYAQSGQKIYRQEVDALGDPDGSMMLTYYLKTMAVLCRKPGEQLPFDDSQRELWIQARAFHFMQMDAATALNVDFFLTSISESSEERPAAVGFLKNHSFAVVAATRLKNVKRSSGRSTIRRKSFRKSGGGK